VYVHTHTHTYTQVWKEWDFDQVFAKAKGALLYNIWNQYIYLSFLNWHVFQNVVFLLDSNFVFVYKKTDYSNICVVP
jgi:hypothetical protein